MFESSSKNSDLTHVEAAAPRRASGSSIESIPENSESEIAVSPSAAEEPAALPEVEAAIEGAHSPGSCDSGTLPAAEAHIRDTSSSGDVAELAGKYAAGKNNNELTVVYCDIEANFGVPSAAPRQPSGKLLRIVSGIVAVGGIAACMLLWNNGESSLLT